MNYELINKENINILVYNISKLDATLNEALQELASITIQSTKSLILDFKNVEELSSDFAKKIIDVHHFIYENNQSFVCCNLNNACALVLKEIDADKILHLVPKQLEAIDMVSMEGLERELLGGDELF
ncbi:MAG: hypothetical protein KA275_02050 [Chitinophagaceae bacterium]|nr:hypothetical protein [Chitinophagaceae bacterium]